MRNMINGLTPIGVDAGSRSIKAAQLRVRGGRRTVVAACELMRPELTEDPAGIAPLSADEVFQLREILERHGFTGRRVVLGIGRTKLFGGVIELPPVGSGAPVEEIARGEVSRMHKVGDQFELTYWPLPPGPHGKSGLQAMALACPHAESEPLLDAFEAAGLFVEAMESCTIASCRACKPVLPAGANLTAVIEIGYSAALLSLISPDAIVYERVLSEHGLSALYATVRDEFDVSSAQAERLVCSAGLVGDGPSEQEIAGAVRRHVEGLAASLEAPFSYAAHQYAVTPMAQVLLIGGGAMLPGLVERIGRSVSVPVRAVGPSDVADCATLPEALHADGSMMTAIGLAGFEGR